MSEERDRPASALGFAGPFLTLPSFFMSMSTQTQTSDHSSREDIPTVYTPSLPALFLIRSSKVASRQPKSDRQAGRTETDGPLVEESCFLLSSSFSLCDVSTVEAVYSKTDEESALAISSNTAVEGISALGQFWRCGSTEAYLSLLVTCLAVRGRQCQDSRIDSALSRESM